MYVFSDIDVVETSVLAGRAASCAQQQAFCSMLNAAMANAACDYI